MTPVQALQASFIAAFFFLPLSKAATYIALGLAMVSLAWALQGGARVHPALPGVSRVALAALTLLPLVLAPLQGEGWPSGDTVRLGALWGLSALCLLAARTGRILPWLQAYLIGLMIATAAAALQAIRGEPLPIGLAALGNHILLSQCLALGLLATALLHRHDPHPRHRWAYRAAGGICLAGLALGAGRTGVIGALAVLPLVVGALLPASQRRWAWAAAGLLALGLLSAPSVRERIGYGVTDLAAWRSGDPTARWIRPDGRQNSLGLRLDMWQVGVELVASHPLAGSGPQGFARAWANRVPDGPLRFTEPHNLYVFYASAFGLPGLAAILAWIGGLLWLGWRHRTELAGAMTLGFGILVALAGLTNTLVFGTTSALMLMLFASLCGAVSPGATPDTPQARAG